MDAGTVVTCDVVPTMLDAFVNAAAEFCMAAADVVFDALIVVATVWSSVCLVAGVGVGVVEGGADDIIGWQGNGVARPDCDSRKG